MISYKFPRNQLWNGFHTPQECIFFSYFATNTILLPSKTLIPALRLDQEYLYREDTQKAIISFCDTYFENLNNKVPRKVTILIDVRKEEEEEEEEEKEEEIEIEEGKNPKKEKNFVCVVSSNGNIESPESMSILIDFDDSLSKNQNPTHGYMFIPSKIDWIKERIDTKSKPDTYSIKHTMTPTESIAMDTTLKQIISSLKSKREILFKFGGNIQSFNGLNVQTNSTKSVQKVEKKPIELGPLFFNVIDHFTVKYMETEKVDEQLLNKLNGHTPESVNNAILFEFKKFGNKFLNEIDYKKSTKEFVTKIFADNDNTDNMANWRGDFFKPIRIIFERYVGTHIDDLSISMTKEYIGDMASDNISKGSCFPLLEQLQKPPYDLNKIKDLILKLKAETDTQILLRDHRVIIKNFAEKLGIEFFNKPIDATLLDSIKQSTETAYKSLIEDLGKIDYKTKIDTDEVREWILKVKEALKTNKLVDTKDKKILDKKEIENIKKEWGKHSTIITPIVLFENWYIDKGKDIDHVVDPSAPVYMSDINRRLVAELVKFGITRPTFDYSDFTPSKLIEQMMTPENKVIIKEWEPIAFKMKEFSDEYTENNDFVFTIDASIKLLSIFIKAEEIENMFKDKYSVVIKAIRDRILPFIRERCFTYDQRQIILPLYTALKIQQPTNVNRTILQTLAIQSTIKNPENAELIKDLAKIYPRDAEIDQLTLVTDKSVTDWIEKVRTRFNNVEKTGVGDDKKTLMLSKDMVKSLVKEWKELFQEKTMPVFLNQMYLEVVEFVNTDETVPASEINNLILTHFKKYGVNNNTSNPMESDPTTFIKALMTAENKRIINKWIEIKSKAKEFATTYDGTDNFDFTMDESVELLKGLYGTNINSKNVFDSIANISDAIQTNVLTHIERIDIFPLYKALNLSQPQYVTRQDLKNLAKTNTKNDNPYFERIKDLKKIYPEGTKPDELVSVENGNVKTWIQSVKKTDAENPVLNQNDINEFKLKWESVSTIPPIALLSSSKYTNIDKVVEGTISVSRKSINELIKKNLDDFGYITLWVTIDKTMLPADYVAKIINTKENNEHTEHWNKIVPLIKKIAMEYDGKKDFVFTMVTFKTILKGLFGFDDTYITNLLKKKPFTIHSDIVINLKHIEEDMLIHDQKIAISPLYITLGLKAPEYVTRVALQKLASTDTKTDNIYFKHIEELKKLYPKESEKKDLKSVKATDVTKWISSVKTTAENQSKPVTPGDNINTRIGKRESTTPNIRKMKVRKIDFEDDTSSSDDK